MKFVVDEGVDKGIVERLRQENYNILYIAELSPSITDEAILKQANDLDALLITMDKDFGELIFRQKMIHIRCYTITFGLLNDCL